MYKDHTVPYRKWKDTYGDYVQMKAFDDWLSLLLKDDFSIPKKSRREYICVLSYISDALMEDGLLIKGLYSLKLPFNSSDLVSLMKRTNILSEVLYDDLDPQIKEVETENIFKIIRLFSAFLDFRPLNPSEKNSYNTYEIQEIIPKKVRLKNTFFYAFSQVFILGLVLFTMILSWFFIKTLAYKVVINIFGILAILFNAFYLTKKYYLRDLEKSLENKDFIRVTAKITDIFWEKTNISGIKRLAIIEFTTPNNNTDERFYLYTFSDTPPKVGGTKYAPITFLHKYNLIVDAPFALYSTQNILRSQTNIKDFR